MVGVLGVVGACVDGNCGGCLEVAWGCVASSGGGVFLS